MITTASAAETFGLPINQTTAFSDKKGNFKERIKKQQLKMLKDYVPLLKQFLEPDEEVLLLMRGCSPMTSMEQFTLSLVRAIWHTYIKKDRKITGSRSRWLFCT